jgi:hypothetical protein
VEVVGLPGGGGLLQVRMSLTAAQPELRLVSDRFGRLNGRAIPKGAEASEGAVGAPQVTQACSQALTQRRRPHTLPSGINYALKLPLASGTGERLSLVFEGVFRGRSASG